MAQTNTKKSYIKKVLKDIRSALKLVFLKNFREETLSLYTYDHLRAYYYLARRLPFGRKIYKNFTDKIWDSNISSLRKKGSLEIAFIVNYASTFCCDAIYKMMERDSFFRPHLVVVANADYVNGGWMLEDYRQTLKEMQERYHDAAIGTFCIEENRQLSWDEIGIHPDLFFNLTPHTLLRGEYSVFSYPLSKLNIYIPYGYLVADNKQKDFVYAQFNQDSHNMMWRIYATTKLDLLNADKYAFLGRKNYLYSGYPKMDAFYRKDVRDETEIWKGMDSDKIKKKIIYAPHHSIGDEDGVSLGTFIDRKEYMLKLARERQDISWIIRPHPQLGLKTVKYGVFESYEEYLKYLEQWDKLPNARVSFEGDYIDIFKTSDAMIMDCASFLAEYLFADKPLLYLMNSDACYNETGKKCLEAYDIMEGKDEKGIQDFIDRIMTDSDYKSKEREQIFRTFFDYKKEHNMTASEFIVKDLKDVFMNQDK